MEDKRAYQKREHNLLYENIKALAKYRGLLMQDIEHGIYRQRGFISRGHPLSAEEVKQIANMLNVSMDDLMGKDYKTHISQLNILMLIQMNVEALRETMKKDECIKEMIRIADEVYGE